MTSKEAINCVKRIRYYMEGGECWTDAEFEAIEMAVKALEQPEPCEDAISRKTGKWIPHKSVFGGLGEKVYTCDQCGYNIGFHAENFCPRCGTDMRERREDG